MLTNFERLAKASRSTVERVHGTAVMIFPAVRQGPNSPLRLSPADQPYRTSALFFEDTQIENESKAQPLTGNGTMLHRSLMRQASIRLIDGKPMQTDFILRREADGALFSITRYDPDGVGNIMATLAVAKALPEA
ncbi:hypothetical protein [Rhizobium sp. CNPSo 4039]|uniref:hypothetical protein n=1 Tax=Rhizobium sp. CNPSo 4039 TaxID=3021409 RepID=UPI00254F3EBC|nr:hypothetical protein [Rhizobium sp. CNPSo 4039]MDK4712996.1 hypothetical protein [Rhizobium sp. CNPSo 4039]